MNILIIFLGISILSHIVWCWLRPLSPDDPVPVGIGLNHDHLMPSVAVVIPSWNDDHVLPRCLRSLKPAVERYHGPVMVKVVSGGTVWNRRNTERVVGDALFGLSWKVIEQTPGGKNAALNQALKDEKSEVLVFLDADTEVDREWLVELVKPLASERAQASTGNFSAFSKSFVSRLYECQQWYNQRIVGNVSLFGGGSIAVFREVLDSISGALDESVRVGVDYHLSESIKSRGYHLAFAESALLRTEISFTWREHWKNELRWRRAYWWNQATLYVSDHQKRRLVGLIYTPIVGVYIILGTVSMLLVLVGALPGVPVVETLWVLGWAWLLGRYVTQAIVVARYMKDRTWVGVLPALVVDFYIGLIVTWIGMVTRKNLNPHFKGRRVVKGLEQ